MEISRGTPSSYVPPQVKSIWVCETNLINDTMQINEYLLKFEVLSLLSYTDLITFKFSGRINYEHNVIPLYQIINITIIKYIKKKNFYKCI